MDQFVQDEGGASRTPETTSAAHQPPVTFMPGGLEFYGTVQSAGDNGIVVSMPDGRTLALTVTPGQTDLSRNNGATPSQGQVIKVHATAMSDGSFLANKLARADRVDRHELEEAEYYGVTTSAVGSDLTLHFQVGMMAFSFPISATADLDDFGHRAHSIGSDQMVEVEVKFQGTRGTVVEVERP